MDMARATEINFAEGLPDITMSAEHAFAITPHDSTNFDYDCRAIYVGVTGDIVAVMRNGKSLGDATVTFKNAQQGSVIPIQCIRVNSTSTTATDLVGLL